MKLLSLKPNHNQFTEDSKTQHQHSRISTQNLVMTHTTGNSSLHKFGLSSKDVSAVLI